MPLADPTPLLEALKSGHVDLISRPANLDGLLASEMHLALTADALATREHLIRRTASTSGPMLRHLVLDVRIGDREALVAALQSTLSAACIREGERRLVVISLAEDLALCQTMIRCIKNLIDAHEAGARFIISCPTPAFARLFQSHCVHVHTRVNLPFDPVNCLSEAWDGDERAPFREGLRSLLDIRDDDEFWLAARTYTLQATTSCMPVRVIGAMLIDLAPCPEVVEACAECERAWRKSGDACTAIQAALVFARKNR
jgi:hypothetical protein